MAMPPEAINALQKTFQKGSLEIVKNMEKLIAEGRKTDHARAALNDSLKILGELDEYSDRWIEDNIPKEYRQGWEEAFIKAVPDGVKAKTSYANFGMLHREAISVVAYNMQDSVSAATASVGRNVQDIYRQVGVEETFTRLFTGETIKGSAKAMKEQLALAGVDSFVDKAGKVWKLDSYCTMVARTTTAEAAVQGTLQRARAGDYKLIQMSEHHPTCEICAPLQGHIYTTDSADRRYPQWQDDYAVIHPNCLHDIFIYIEQYDSKYEENLERAKNFDPNTDPRSQAEKDAYAALQRENRRLSDLRNHHSRYVARLGPDNVPSIQGFARMKRANSAKYQELQSRYRAAGVPEPRAAKGVSYPFDKFKADRYYIKDDVMAGLKKKGVSEEEYIKRVSEAAKTANDRADIGIRVPDDVVEKILNDGRFKTQFETQTSGGFLDIENRINIEKQLFNVPEGLPAQERPIYGMLIDDSTKNLAGEYGDVIVKLKKGNVYDRTTFTYGDSIMSDALASPLSNPHAVSVPRSGSDYFFLGKVDDVISGKEGIANLTDGAYAEAQIHGGVSVSDIDTIVFQSSPSQAIIAKLKELGIKYLVGG